MAMKSPMEIPNGTAILSHYLKLGKGGKWEGRSSWKSGGGCLQEGQATVFCRSYTSWRTSPDVAKSTNQSRISPLAFSFNRLTAPKNLFAPDKMKVVEVVIDVSIFSSHAGIS